MQGFQIYFCAIVIHKGEINQFPMIPYSGGVHNYIICCWDGKNKISITDLFSKWCSFDLEMSNLEPVPATSKAAIAKDTVLFSKAKQVGIIAQSDILKQVSTTTGMPFKGISKSNVQSVGKQVIQDTASKVCDSIKGMKRLPLISASFW